MSGNVLALGGGGRRDFSDFLMDRRRPERIEGVTKNPVAVFGELLSLTASRQKFAAWKPAAPTYTSRRRFLDAAHCRATDRPRKSRAQLAGDCCRTRCGGFLRLACAIAGNTMLARIAMMPMMTSHSIQVKPHLAQRLAHSSFDMSCRRTPATQELDLDQRPESPRAEWNNRNGHRLIGFRF